jgi:hypothetical protein
MKIFIRKLVLFFIPIIIGMAVIDIFLSHILLKSNTAGDGENLVWNDVLNSKIDANIVIYGSSKAWTQYNPALFENNFHVGTYNLGIDGHNFWLQYLRHDLFLKNNKVPENIIYSIDLFSFQKRKDLYNKEQFLPILLWNFEIYNFTKDYEGFSLSDYFIPLWRYTGQWRVIRGALRDFLMPRLYQPIRNKGYAGQKRDWQDDLAMAKKEKDAYEINFHTPTINLFDGFIKFCKKNDINLILVLPPMHKSGQEFISNRKVFTSKVDSIIEHNNIPYFNFSDYHLNNSEAYFYNSAHLNDKGSQVFTEDVIDSIQKYKLIK